MQEGRQGRCSIRQDNSNDPGTERNNAHDQLTEYYPIVPQVNATGYRTLDPFSTGDTYRQLLERLESLYPGMGRDMAAWFIESLPLGADLTPFCSLPDNELLERLGDSLLNGEDVADTPDAYLLKLRAAKGGIRDVM